jgi:putative lipoprotein
LQRLELLKEDAPPHSDASIHREKKTMIRSLLFALALIFLAFCVVARAGTLRGESWYRERIALPPEALFEALLLDVSRADASAEVLGRARLEPLGNPPFRFKINYDDAAIHRGHRYAVRATVTLGGHVYFMTDRNYPAFGGDKPLRMLLVRARGSGRSSLRSAGSPLRNTYWRLTHLGDTPTRRAERQREAHLIFAAHEQRVSGSGGCNRITGGFDLDGDKLRLSRMAGTMMACPEGMEQERLFLQSLTKIDSYRISGDQLEMLDASSAVVARFVAVALR